jgi:predicted metal-dependent phosphoesterase TrpH
MLKRRKLRGALHIHSSISYDGTMSVEELSFFFRKRRFDFLLLTEHSENVSNEVMNKLIDECKRFSSSEFLVIPGLEFGCRGDLHILGLGVRKVCESDDPLKVIGQIGQQGGIAVLAHPTKENYPLDGIWIQELDGVEIWNSAYDGKFLPQSKSINMFKKLAEQNPRLKPVAGIDMHREQDYYDVGLRIEGNNLNQDQVLRQLRKGNFTVESTFFNIKPGMRIGGASLLMIFAFRKILNLVRMLRDLSSVREKN